MNDLVRPSDAELEAATVLAGVAAAFEPKVSSSGTIVASEETETNGVPLIAEGKSRKKRAIMGPGGRAGVKCDEKSLFIAERDATEPDRRRRRSGGNSGSDQACAASSQLSNQAICEAPSDATSVDRGNGQNATFPEFSVRGVRDPAFSYDAHSSESTASALSFGSLDQTVQRRQVTGRLGDPYSQQSTACDMLGGRSSCHSQILGYVAAAGIRIMESDDAIAQLEAALKMIPDYEKADYLEALEFVLAERARMGRERYPENSARTMAPATAAATGDVLSRVDTSDGIGSKLLSVDKNHQQECDKAMQHLPQEEKTAYKMDPPTATATGDVAPWAEILDDSFSRTTVVCTEARKMAPATTIATGDVAPRVEILDDNRSRLGSVDVIHQQQFEKAMQDLPQEEKTVYTEALKMAPPKVWKEGSNYELYLRAENFSLNHGGRFRPKQEEQWAERFGDLCDYRERTGNCLVPPNHYKENPPLGRWVKRQRYLYKLIKQGKPCSMTEERRNALEEIGFVWDSQDASWGEHVNELLEFKLVHKHCRVPRNYGNLPLANWVRRQRRQYKHFLQDQNSTLTSPRIGELNGIGFEWNLRPSLGPPTKKTKIC
jgi:hypothetical protein